MPRLILVLLTALISACTSLPQPPESQRFYTLVLAPSTLITNSNGPVLLIDVIEAVPGYETSNMVYGSKPWEMSAYRDSFWADAPAKLMQSIVSNALHASGKYKLVMDHRVSQAFDQQLFIDQFYVRQNTQSDQVEIGLRFTVSDARSRSVLIAKHLYVEQPLAQVSADGYAQAANEAVAKLIQALVDSLP